jgi:hypothetical protein
MQSLTPTPRDGNFDRPSKDFRCTKLFTDDKVCLPRLMPHKSVIIAVHAEVYRFESCVRLAASTDE